MGKQETQLSKKDQEVQLKKAINELKSSDANTRIRAVNTIATMSQDVSPAIPFLLNLIGDETPTQLTVKESQQGCVDCGSFSPEVFTAKKLTLGDRVTELLSVHPSDVIPEFEKMLTDRNAQVRRRVVCALSQLKADIPVQKVIPLGTDSDVQTRKCVISVLGNSSDTITAAVHIGYFAQKDSDNYVRYLAIRTLAILHEKKSLSVIIELLKDQERGVVLEAIEALCMFPVNDVQSVLKSLTQHADKKIQEKASEAIKKLDNKR